MGTARIPTVQISNRVRATGDSPWASYQVPAVIDVPLGGARRQPRRLDRNLGGQLVERPQNALELGQLVREAGVKLVLPQHT